MGLHVFDRLTCNFQISKEHWLHTYTARNSPWHHHEPMQRLFAAAKPVMRCSVCLSIIPSAGFLLGASASYVFCVSWGFISFVAVSVKLSRDTNAFVFLQFLE